jgi:hypothetical protein
MEGENYGTLKQWSDETLNAGKKFKQWNVKGFIASLNCFNAFGAQHANWDSELIVRQQEKLETDKWKLEAC